MNRHRVVITGLGVISALGHNKNEFWDALCAGRSGIGPIQSVDTTNLRFKNGAEIRGFVPEDHFAKKPLDVLDRFAQLALVAAREAVADAGIEWTDVLRERTAVVTGSCLGGQSTEDKAYHDLYAKQKERLHPLTIPRAMDNAAASHVATEMGVVGPAFTISTACASSTHAIGQAAWLIRQGVVDLAIAGGSETPFTPFHLKTWEAMRVVAPDTCRPFSKGRKGLILGEGAGMLTLESLDSAQARDAPIFAELIGFGMSADAGHITKPCPRGAARAMCCALLDGEIEPVEVDHVNAHGTGTQANDSTEAYAIRNLFGDHAAAVAVTSTKPSHGHALGAAGALEAVATTLTLQRQVIPAIATFRERDSDCDLNLVLDHPREMPLRVALCNSFAFGGLNAVLAFHRWSPS